MRYGSILGREVLRQTVAVAIAAAAMSFTATAMAVAVPVSPMGGERTNSHPTLAWSLPATETSWTAQIATSPSVTPAGEFFDENQVDSELFDDATTSYSPTRALPAGSYWWTISSYPTEGSFDVMYSEPQAFVVPLRLRIAGLRARKERGSFSSSVEVSVTWVTNVPNVRVIVRIKNRKGKRRAVFTRRDRTSFATLNKAETTTETWFPNARQQGKRYRIEVTVIAGGKKVVKRRNVRAPKSTF